MKNDDSANISKKIKEFSWEIRVERTGFLQPKGIANEAEIIPVPLTSNVTAKYDNVFWVKDFNLYDDDKTKHFRKVFEIAFEEKKDWPLHIIDYFKNVKIKVDAFIKLLVTTDWSSASEEEKKKAFIGYKDLFLDIQRYYVIAVPLTNYCEEKLKDFPEVISENSVPFDKLDVDFIYSSKDPIKDFAWIKTSYNILHDVKEGELDFKEVEEEESKKIDIPKGILYLVNGMQIGIYTRNRMKELSQQLWFYVESLVKVMAKDLELGRDDFFYLTWREVINSYDDKKLVISGDEIIKRKKCFSIGILDNKEYLISGNEAKNLEDFFNKVDSSAELKGSVAFKGRVTGKVRVVANLTQFKDFKEGEILVTTMTTPDFVVIMNKASGIITDEGGLSCHAAIVSRELKIPCVIGTKFASKILKTGDVIELDAENGIVKLLD